MAQLWRLLSQQVETDLNLAVSRSSRQQTQAQSTLTVCALYVAVLGGSNILADPARSVEVLGWIALLLLVASSIVCLFAIFPRQIGYVHANLYLNGVKTDELFDEGLSPAELQRRFEAILSVRTERLSEIRANTTSRAPWLIGAQVLLILAIALTAISIGIDLSS